MEYAKKYCFIETYIGPSCKHELVTGCKYSVCFAINKRNTIAMHGSNH